MRFIRLAAIIAAAALSGCATFHHPPIVGVEFNADSGGVAYHRFGRRFGSTGAGGALLVDCVAATPTPCNQSSNPGNGTQGMPAWESFGVLNQDNINLYGMYPSTVGLLFGNGLVPNPMTAVAPASTGIWCLDFASSTTAAPTLVSCPSGSGTVTSVGISVPSWLTATGGPITSSGSFTLASATGLTADEFLATPCGTTGTLGLRVICNTDLPGSGSLIVNGQAVSLGSSVNVNAGAQQYSIALNGASGAAIGSIAVPGSTGTYCIDYTSLTANPTLTNTGCPGSGGSGITTQTNGTNNSSQSTFNLESGPGISCANPSSGNVQCSSSYSIRTATGATDTILSSDCANGVEYTSSSATAVTVPQATGSFAGCTVDIYNHGTGLVTLTPTTSTINGNATQTVGSTFWANVAAVSGNYLASGTATALFASYTGSITATHCAEWSAAGVLEDSGGSCGGSGTPENVQVFTSGGTWTKPSGSPQLTDVICTGAGGGGGSGAVVASGTAASGGGGGGGGSTVEMLFPTSALTSTVTVTVGTGGNGGASVTSTGAGHGGSNGGNSTFGSYLTAYGGGLGGAGSASTVSLGGSGAGLLSAAAGITVGSMCGGVEASGGTGSVAGCSGGGGAGGGSPSTGAAGNAGSGTLKGGSGAGSGAGVTTAPASSSGGNSGPAGNSAAVSGGTAGNTGTTGSTGAGAYAGGTGGGGGGSATSGNAGAGGAGAVGGGGGGGGAAVSGGDSGAGGTGGNGMCVATTTY